MTATTTTTTTFKAGDKVRITGDSNYNGLGIGSIATLLRPSHGAPDNDHWLATKDGSVTDWTHGVCTNVKIEEMELVVEPDPEEIEDGALVTGVSGHGEPYTGKLEPKGYPYERADERTVVTEDGLRFYVLAESLARVPSVTLEDVLALTEEFKTAERSLTSAEGDVTYYEAQLAREVEARDRIQGKRDAAHASLQAALVAFKG